MSVPIALFVKAFVAVVALKALRLQVVPHVVVHIPHARRLYFVAEQACEKLSLTARGRTDPLLTPVELFEPVAVIDHVFFGLIRDLRLELHVEEIVISFLILRDSN